MNRQDCRSAIPIHGKRATSTTHRSSAAGRSRRGSYRIRARCAVKRDAASAGRSSSRNASRLEQLSWFMTFLGKCVGRTLRRTHRSVAAAFPCVPATSSLSRQRVRFPKSQTPRPVKVLHMSPNTAPGVGAEVTVSIAAKARCYVFPFVRFLRCGRPAGRAAHFPATRGRNFACRNWSVHKLVAIRSSHTRATRGSRSFSRFRHARSNVSWVKSSASVRSAGQSQRVAIHGSHVLFHRIERVWRHRGFGPRGGRRKRLVASGRRPVCGRRPSLLPTKDVNARPRSKEFSAERGRES